MIDIVSVYWPSWFHLGNEVGATLATFSAEEGRGAVKGSLFLYCDNIFFDSLADPWGTPSRIDVF